MVVVGGAFFPWWLCVIAALAYALWYSASYELFVVGVIFDASYGTSFSLRTFPYIYTSCMAAVLLCSLYAQNYTRFSAERKKI